MGSFLERPQVCSSPRRGIQAGKETGSPASVASHDARHPVSFEALGARLETAALPPHRSFPVPTVLPNDYPGYPGIAESPATEALSRIQNSVSRRRETLFGIQSAWGRFGGYGSRG
jgi:hypothetical protein